jgi:hypothetical protein
VLKGGVSVSRQASTNCQRRSIVVASITSSSETCVYAWSSIARASWAGHRRLALWVVFIEHHHLLLKGISKQFVAMLPQEHKQRGTVDALNDGVFCRRQLNGRMP